MLHARAIVLLVFAAVLWGGCASEDAPLFERLPAEATGVDFNNAITEDDSLLNPIDYDYFYNGGGVAVGDFDNDGQADLYFAGNVVANRLYLNRGDLQFEDVTEAAGVGAEDAWSTGVTLVDINQDGWLDIYVSVAGKVDPQKRANRLFVHQGLDAQGVPRFEEAAQAYGIADTGYSTHAAFFDYDKDGDLDLFVLTNTIEDVSRNAIRPVKTQGTARSTDKLYRNNGDGTFADVSKEAGIQIEGYGLGVVISDVNQDGWPDIYCGNDFITNDVLYINNQDGTFTNQMGRHLKSQSYNAMGVDIADFNNDSRPDIVVLDMLPHSNKRLKLMLSGGVYERFHASLRQGYEPQYVRNTLQVNNGVNPEGRLTFSEIGQLAGVHDTDWSWAPLFADFDNDGLKDLFVSNGYGKDVTNLDFLAYGQEEAAFGSRASNRKILIDAMKALPEVKLPNVMFANNGDLTFTDKSTVWGLTEPSLSNGAAFADLDNDGDLDLVTNNIGDEAFILRNTTRERDQAGAHNYLRVNLQGPATNRAGLGAKVVVTNGGARQYHDHTTYRGYQSTVEPTIHFGLAADSTADALEVYWPDGTYQRLTDVAGNQVVTLSHADAALMPQPGDASALALGEQPDSDEPHPFEPVAAQVGLAYEHAESTVADFKMNPLLPHKYSQSGPGLAIGDVDGNGLDDVYIGADRGQAGALFMQTAPRQFASQGMPSAAASYEDMGALFFDAEGDGDLDLYVVSGGNIAPPGHVAYQDRLYANDGTGRLRLARTALPALRASGSCVTAADYDRDGDLDLFIGGRVVPGDYPLPARSYLLRNDSEEGRLAFTDVTKTVAPGLAEAGLVTSALWTDFDNDGRVDLLVAGEWMPLTFFKNTPEGFSNVTRSTGLADATGWWNSLVAGDFDNDGDTDYVAGNLGLNSQYKASSEEPVRIHAADFDKNGDLDPVLSRYIEGVSYPDHPRDAITTRILGMNRRFETYTEYAEAPFDDLFTRAELQDAYTTAATHFETSYVENNGDGTFTLRPLPVWAQAAPAFGLLARDYNGDGHLDLLMVGNSYASHPRKGWYDASIGGLWTGDGQGQFTWVDDATSGFFVDGDAKSLAEVMTGPRQSLVLAGQNGDSLRVFTAPDEKMDAVRLRPLDAYAELTLRGGQTRRQEFHYGSAYLSQSSRVLRLSEDVQEAVVYDFTGTRRMLKEDSEHLAQR